MQDETMLQPVEAQGIPAEVLKRKEASWFYLIAVGALALVVIGIPILSRFGEPIPSEVWSGWNICIGGLIALIGQNQAQK